MNSESSYDYNPDEEAESTKKIESRFGNSQEIIDLMVNGDIEILGSIEDICGDIRPHANQVDIAKIPAKHANKILGVKIQKGDSVIQCVFKPKSGENQAVKQKTLVDNFYTRECAAWVISEHFGFDLVPPTIIREVDGEIGSLQLFLDHSYFKNVDPSEDTSITESSDDWKKMAVFDWILANCERHNDNMMVAIDNPTQMAAIDHGIILSASNYAEMAVRGPSLQFTHDNRSDQPVVIEIPDWLIEIVTDGQKRKEELNSQFAKLGHVTEQQIESFWLRVDAIIKHRKYLSKYNHKVATGISFLGAGY